MKTLNLRLAKWIFANLGALTLITMSLNMSMLNIATFH